MEDDKQFAEYLERLQNDLQTVDVFKEFDQVIEAHPAAFPYAKARVVLFEGDQHAVHGPVLEDDQKRHRQQTQHDQRPLLP